MEQQSQTTSEWERNRLAALYQYNMVEWKAIDVFKRYTQLAATVMNMPVSFISFVDAENIRLIAPVGIAPRAQVLRQPGLCASAIETGEYYCIEDILEDRIAKENPFLEQAANLRCYAAGVLQNKQGHNLGTLAVMDYHPTVFSESQRSVLTLLALCLMESIELCHNCKSTEQPEKEVFRALRHDLKNPLTVVALEAQLIRTDKRLPQDVVEMGEQIALAGKKMVAIINSKLQ